MHANPPQRRPPAPDPAFVSCGCAHVAVYGTLRAQGVNDIRRLAPGLAAVGHTHLHGQLHDLGWYPGLVLNGARPVLAEVYPLQPALEQVLDRIEGLWPQDLGEYTKRLQSVVVHAADGGPAQQLQVLVYEASPAAVRHAPVLHCTDWLAWFTAHKQQAKTGP